MSSKSTKALSSKSVRSSRRKGTGSSSRVQDNSDSAGEISDSSTKVVNQSRRSKITNVQDEEDVDDVVDGGDAEEDHQIPDDVDQMEGGDDHESDDQDDGGVDEVESEEDVGNQEEDRQETSPEPTPSIQITSMTKTPADKSMVCRNPSKFFSNRDLNPAPYALHMIILTTVPHSPLLFLLILDKFIYLIKCCGYMFSSGNLQDS